MSILYKPVLIESTEQAEALPEGTVAICAEDWPAEKSGGLWGRQGYPSSFLADTGDWQALVPIEAEEEWKTLHEGSWHPKADEDEARRDANSLGARRRYTTDWEEA